jgi:ribonuclease P protein component
VVRNRIRRRMYEVIREQEPGIENSYDLVFSVYSSELASFSYPELKQLIVDQLCVAGVVKNYQQITKQ